MDRSGLERLDAELRSQWGIDLRSIEESRWWDDLACECHGERFALFRELQLRYSERACGAEADESLERAFYDLVAEEPFSGFVHSHRRSVILDAAVLVDDLIEREVITGRVLDVGCHVGYLAAWLARRNAAVVVACDICRPALAAGRIRCQALGRRVEFVEADLLPAGGDGQFDLIVAVDVLPEDQESGLRGLRRLAAGLSDRGWLILSTGHPLDVAWSPLSRVRETLREVGLGFVEAGCLGGVVAPGHEPLGQNVFVLRRGGREPLPDDCVDRARRGWPAFLDYAAGSRVADREKSQAWFELSRTPRDR
ncbi:MAG: methyltransferase domain-containing protein [Planctomycetaceae bacterium]